MQQCTEELNIRTLSIKKNPLDKIYVVAVRGRTTSSRLALACVISY